MKIDLHLHTLASISNGDTIKWSSLYDTLKKLKVNNVEIASFTDHNIFDYELYKKAYQLALTGKIKLLPGIEVNVVRKNGIIGHMLIIFNDNLTDQELLMLQKEANTILKNGVSLSNINNLFSNFETIRIIHIGKNDFFSYEDLEGLNYDAFEITNEMHPNYKQVLKKGFISSVVAFSDTHVWDKYPQQGELVTIVDDIGEKSFNALKKALKQNKIYYKKRYS
ncbi:PHP domain-containing protein [Malacoplasma iowae]|uniref:PHP domain-containing protein n=1 Tax=Malacoplasma iowae TaxID=2116 RepID=UPI002A18A116|nr:PHP domain-containing protein [Malacoplasma iowae]WPL37952.1 PHP domain-containing protein [Malacoplasma iowae]